MNPYQQQTPQQTSYGEIHDPFPLSTSPIATIGGGPYIDLNQEPAILYDDREPTFSVDDLEADYSLNELSVILFDEIEPAIPIFNELEAFLIDEIDVFHSWAPIVLDENLDSLGEDNNRAGSGMTEERISALLQVSTIRGKWDLNREAEEEDVCAICLGEYEPHDMMGTLECRHGYHEKCIKHWLLQKNLCPMCKATALTV